MLSQLNIATDIYNRSTSNFYNVSYECENMKYENSTTMKVVPPVKLTNFQVLPVLHHMFSHCLLQVPVLLGISKVLLIVSWLQYEIRYIHNTLTQKHNYITYRFISNLMNIQEIMRITSKLVCKRKFVIRIKQNAAYQQLHCKTYKMINNSRSHSAQYKHQTY